MKQTSYMLDVMLINFKQTTNPLINDSFHTV
jgi:hypothetical protein